MQQSLQMACLLKHQLSADAIVATALLLQGQPKQRHTMADLKLKDKTVLRSLGLGGFFGGGAEGMVDVKDGRIVRIRPMRYGWKYTKEEVRQWRMSKNGKSIEPTWKSLPGPFSLAYKKRVYSANRIAYPLKRVDWDPEAERNTQNRGRSKYVRISWDEASSIIAAEIERIHQTY